MVSNAPPAARICCLDLDTFFVSVERLLELRPREDGNAGASVDTDADLANWKAAMTRVLEAIAGRGALIAKGCYHDAPKMGGTHKGAAAGLSPSSVHR